MRRGTGLFVELLCPIILLAILADCTSRVGWVTYNRDTEIYASVARLWREGLIPYRDVYDFKPPLIFVLLRAGFALWGYEPESLRRLLMLATTCGALALYAGLRYARRWITAPVAALGLMTLVVANPWDLPLQNTETLVAALGAAAIGCAAAHQRRPRWWWAMATGSCLALATMAKQPAALFAAALGAQLCLWGAPERWRARGLYVLQRAWWAAAGFLTVVAAFVAYFAWHGAAAAFYDAVLVDGARYSGDFSSTLLHPVVLKRLVAQRTPLDVFGALHNPLMWPFLGAVAALIPLTLLRRSRWTAIAWLWLLVAALAVLAGPRGEGHYLVMAFPALAFVTGIVCELICPASAPPASGGVSTEASRVSWPSLRGEARLLGGILIALLLFGVIWKVKYLPGRGYEPGPNSIEQQAQAIGRAIHAAAQPGDTLLVEDEPIDLYLYSGVRPATRFIYYNAPHRLVDADRAAALERRPTFVFLTHAAADQLRSEPGHEGGKSNLWSKVLRQHYAAWLTSPLGVVYRRLGRTGARENHAPHG